MVIYGYYPTKSWWEEIKEYTDENNIKFYQIPEIPFPKSMPLLKTVMPPNIKAWLKLKKIIKNERPDIAHLHGYGFILVSVLADVLHKFRIKYIYTLHGSPVSPDKMGGFIKFGFNIYKIMLGNSTLRNTYKMTAVSEYTKTFQEFKKYKNNIIVINNGIDLIKFKYNKNEVSIYSRYLHPGDNKEYIICLSLGRIEWLKGFQYFIDGLPNLIEDGFNIKYFIAGTDNGYKNEIDELIKKYKLENNVFYLGHLNFDQKLNALANCDYIIVPSIVENFPAVPLEALAMKKIPIVNNAGGLPEIIRNNYNGLVLDFQKKESFLDSFKNFLKDDSLHLKIIKNMSTVEKYDWENITSSYINIYDTYE